MVELTETAALHHFEENARFVSQLRELGVRVAIDDFGAGYTSFRNLQMLHVDAVKIDGSYVKDLSASPGKPGLRAHADGAGQEFRHARWWRNGWARTRTPPCCESFGVDYFQGFHFGEPLLEPAWSKS